MKGSLTRALVLVLVLSSTAFGQYSFDFVGGGARAEGMGKAYLAVSDDVSGVSWNPAGIYGIEKPVLGFSWSSLAPRGAANAAFINTWEHLEHTSSFSNVGLFSFAAPLRVKGHPFVGSISYTRNFDVFASIASSGSFERTIDTTIAGIHLLNTEYLDIVNNYSLDGGVNSVNFGFGTRLYDKLSFGVTANVYTGSALQVDNMYAVVENSLYGIMQNGTAIQDSTIVDTFKFSGTNFTIGFKYNGDKTNAALTIRTPFKLKVEYDRLVYNIIYMNGLVLDFLTDTTYYMDNLVKYDMPWIIGGGFAYKVRDNFLVAMDAEYRAFKGGKINVRQEITINPGGDNIETYLESDPRWNNVFTVRMGTEYLKETKYGTIPLRAGLGVVPTPEPNYDADGNTSKAVGYYGSLGTGIHWEQIHFDVAYSLYTIDVQYYDQYDYTNRNHHLNVSFTGVF
ncbi:MAG: hypothetical protein AB1483_07095 [Candidatus Zixiibacteriota bacterium]